MNRQDYLSRQNADRKKNGQFTREALSRVSDKFRDAVLRLKDYYYTSPMSYGRGLANAPRHAHAKGKRVLHTTNF